MAKFIELVGLPGAGKTTTYNYLRTKLKRQNIKFPEDLQQQENSLGNVLGRKFATLLSKLSRSREHLVTMGLDDGTNLMNRFVMENAEMNRRFWYSVTHNNFYGKDARFHIVNYMRKVIERVQRIKDDSSSGFFVLDEGIVHNINYFMGSNETGTDEGQILEVLSSPATPEGIVFFGGNVKTIVERTISRKEILGRDMGLSFEDLVSSRTEAMEEWKRCLKLIDSRNIPILCLDADKGIEEKAKEIASFVAYLNS